MHSIQSFLVCLMRLLCVMAALGWQTAIQAKTVSDTGMPLNPIETASVLVDPSNALSLIEVTSPAYQSKFKPATNWGNELNLGFGSDTYWIKLPLTARGSGKTSWVLEIPYFGLDHIDLYHPDGSVVKTGSLLSIESRDLFYRYYAFHIDLDDRISDFYLRVQSKQNITVPLRLWDQASFDRHLLTDTLIQAFYYGGLGVLAAFNFLIFLYLRDRSHLYYSLYAILFGLGIFAGNGYGRLLIWTQWPGWDQISQVVLLLLGTIAALLFTSIFLNTKENQPVVDRILRVLAIAVGGYCMLLILSDSLGISKNVLFTFFPYLVMPIIFMVLYAGARAWQAKQYSAKFFLLAWGMLCAGGMMASLRQLDVIPTNWLTSYALQISSSLEMMLLSLALASRIQHERMLREKAQLEALTSKESLVQTLLASEERLERQVQLRTNDLRTMLESEKRLREQYIRFGSLISHEFRNPLGIIENQAALLTRLSDNENEKKRLSIIRSATHRLALLFDRWLQGDRLESHIDKDRPQLIQLDAWLREVIEKCNGYHPNHRVIFNATAKSPVLLVDEKMLEVVVLNIIDNACKYSALHSTVIVKMIEDSSRVGISIRDSGIGIDPALHDKIFDEYVQVNPLPDKRGYGLGLSFVKKVMSFYGGEIQVISALGEGSEFIAWFPETSVSQQT